MSQELEGTAYAEDFREMMADGEARLTANCCGLQVLLVTYRATDDALVFQCPKCLEMMARVALPHRKAEVPEVPKRQGAAAEPVVSPCWNSPYARMFTKERRDDGRLSPRS